MLLSSFKKPGLDDRQLSRLLESDLDVGSGSKILDKKSPSGDWCVTFGYYRVFRYSRA